MVVSHMFNVLGKPVRLFDGFIGEGSLTKSRVAFRETAVNHLCRPEGRRYRSLCVFEGHLEKLLVRA